MGEVIWATFFFQEVFPHADDDDDDKGRMGPPTYVARCGAENNQKCFLCFMYFCVFLYWVSSCLSLLVFYVFLCFPGFFVLSCLPFISPVFSCGFGFFLCYFYFQFCHAFSLIFYFNATACVLCVFVFFGPISISSVFYMFLCEG